MNNRLFDRLSGQFANSELTGVEQLCHSISLHLGQLLGTRQGASQTVPDLGLPDLNTQHLSPFDAIHHVRREVEKVVRKYEPRLQHARVEFVGDPNSPLEMRFAVSGQIEVQGQIIQVSFHTNVGQTGKVEVITA